MAINQTKNLKLNTWLENEPVDFEEINDNFEKIDKLPFVIESGSKIGSYTGGSNSSNIWRYKKYSDGTIEMSTKLEYNNLKCNNGTEAPYYSSDSKVTFPFALKEVYNVQMHLASNTIGWVADITNKTVLDSVTFKVATVYKENDLVYKQVFLNVKGVLA